MSQAEAANEKPLVYSCSGASSAAQMTNHLAVKLDRANLAEMSCIAGVGGDVPPLVRKAKSGRVVIVLDGCALSCGQASLRRHGVSITRYYQLGNLGVKKEYGKDYCEKEADRVYKIIKGSLADTRPGPVEVDDGD